MSYLVNRRHFKRSRVKVKYCLTKASSKQVYTAGDTLELGLGGVRVISDQKLQLYTLVEIQLESMDGKLSVGLEGRVVWFQEQYQEAGESLKEPIFIVGIQFLNLHTEKDKETIFQLMKRVRN